MKKILSAIMAIMLISCAVSFAEETAQITSTDLGTIELAYEPTWIDLDNSMRIAVPSDWNALDVRSELAATGIVYMAQNPEKTFSMSLSYFEVGTTDQNSLTNTLVSMYPSLSIILANDVSMIAYDDEEVNYSALVMFDENGGAYVMDIFPMIEDETLKMNAITIMTTLGPAETEESPTDATEAPAN